MTRARGGDVTIVGGTFNANEGDVHIRAGDGRSRWRHWPAEIPPPGEAVLVWHALRDPERADPGDIEIGWRDSDGIWHTDQGVNMTLEDIYWMLLPEPPR